MKRLSMVSLAMAMIVSFMAGSAQAQGNLFSPLDPGALSGKALNADKSFTALEANPAYASVRLVQANINELKKDVASLSLNLAPGLELRAHHVTSYLNRSGSVVWAGVIEDPGSAMVPFSPESLEFDPVNSATLVRNGDKITGTVHFAGEWYKIRPLKSGGHAIIAMNRAAMPPDHPAEYNQLRTIPMRTRQTPAPTKANTVIRVLVSYTPAAAAAAGDISGLIDLAVAETNLGYTGSGVLIDAVLATKAQTNYTESGSFSTDLSRYRSTSDGFMDEIHATRDSSAADVGVLIINNASACGLASSIGSTPASAFAAVYWDCATGYYSFAHEIGHLQSARHDPKNDPTKTPYAYGHGYQYTARGASWRTIMAYDCARGGCPRLNFWSNPLKLYNGVPMGTASASDNARVLNNTAATVSSFR